MRLVATPLARLAVAALALAGLSACQQPDIAAEEPPRLVRVVTVASRDHAATASLTGEVQARTKIDLAFRVTGQISEINVTVGDHITAGQVLARIGSEAQRADLGLADSSLQAAEAALEQATAEPVVSVAHDGRRDAVFNVHETLLFVGSDQLRVATVDIAPAADANVRTTGRIREVSPTVDPRSGTVRVRVTLHDAPAAMTLGSLVTGRVTMPVIPAIMVPWSAITLDRGQPAVWLVDPGGTQGGAYACPLFKSLFVYLLPRFLRSRGNCNAKCLTLATA